MAAPTSQNSSAPPPRRSTSHARKISRFCCSISRWKKNSPGRAASKRLQQEFSVWYQPKYDLATHQLVGAEALVRWQSPELGLLPPGRFIEVFERNGFAVRLDYYMLGHVARFLEDRMKRGLPVVPVSVNQSALHISEGGYLRKMKETAEAYGLPAGLLDLEVTETAFVDFKTKEARESSRHIIDSLKSYGYATSMDDFCTGYSSIAMLQNLPMDSMKIDRSILLAAEHEASSWPPNTMTAPCASSRTSSSSASPST